MKTTIAGVLVSILWSGIAAAAPLDIVYSPLGDRYQSRSFLLDEAETFWESRLTGYRDGIDADGLSITVDVLRRNEDFLARAAPDRVRRQSGLSLAETGVIEINEVGFERLIEDRGLSEAEVNDWILTTLIHETAHVLGFGTLWQSNGLSVTGSGTYTGRNALDAYRAEFDADAAFVPVETEYGPGTENSHWSWSEFAGPQGELLQGFIAPDSYFSDTSLAAFRDLGFTTIPTALERNVVIAAVPVPASVWLAVAGLGALTMTGWRRRAV